MLTLSINLSDHVSIDFIKNSIKMSTQVSDYMFLRDIFDIWMQQNNANMTVFFC